VKALPDPGGRRVLMGLAISGTSMNPARSLASAIPAHAWAPLWIYWVAPPLGMLLAGHAYVARHGLARVFCAKLHHANHHRCIFRCRYTELTEGPPPAAASKALRAVLRPRA
jgi:hypothetical protein